MYINVCTHCTFNAIFYLGTVLQNTNLVQKGLGRVFVIEEGQIIFFVVVCEALCLHCLI